MKRNETNRAAKIATIADMLVAIDGGAPLAQAHGGGYTLAGAFRAAVDHAPLDVQARAVGALAERGVSLAGVALYV
jgi:hypothetical protein